MATIRFWRQTDLPYLLHMAGEASLLITPKEDLARSNPDFIRKAAEFNLMGGLCSPGATALVAEDNGRPVGFLLVTLQPSDMGGELSGYMADIYIDPAYRGSGLGRDLHFAGEAYLKPMGIRSLTNWVHATNEKGQRAAESYGVKPWAVMMSKPLIE